ncbi:MAG: hypothetical protein HC920_05625 [Oscillatoriales cyanobacterium SM2_3_0]|nr:hypothetical protein [Oscillatoriales cyanobacterium SM2_3_0]
MSQLPSRYELKRSTIYSRMASLGIQPTQVGRRSYVDQAQLVRLDALDKHLKAGGVFAEFIEPGNAANGQVMERKPAVPNVQSNGKQLGKVLEDLSSLGVLGQSPVEELSARLMLLEHAAQYHWLLPTDDLVMVLGFVPEQKRFSRYGFEFECRGEEWLVRKTS